AAAAVRCERRAPRNDSRPLYNEIRQSRLRGSSFMDALPSVELLESTHTFPGPYMFKVIGWSADHFAERVVDSVRDEMGASDNPPYRVRQTAGGRHVSVTLEPVMESAWQVLAIYGRLREARGMIMIW